MAAYWAGVRIVGIQNKKARAWIIGRFNWQGKLQLGLSNLQKNDDGTLRQTIWMHCSSLGEFEQGRPVIEKLKTQHPSVNIIVSFFSPSGYEIMKNYDGAEVVCYLPMDSPANAADFINLVRPTIVLWVKYEYWFYYLKEINSRNIPLLLISGTFRADQPFFKWHGHLHRQMLHFFTHLFVQNEPSKTLAAQIIPAEKITISGDTRFDRVIAIAEKYEPVALVESWLQDAEKVLVAGSTWDEDEEELIHYTKLHPEIKFIIAPHNTNDEEVKELLRLFPGSIPLSVLAGTDTGHQPKKSNILIIDNVGMLARLYRYATVAYVGGGFGNDGVHNVLEAAVYGRPVVHGPEYEKFAEAKGLIAAGGAFEIADALELEKVLDKLFTDTAFYNEAADAAKNFVYARQGPTEKVVDYIGRLQGVFRV